MCDYHFPYAHKGNITQDKQSFQQSDKGLYRPSDEHSDELQHSEYKDESGKKWVHNRCFLFCIKLQIKTEK